MSRVRCFVGLPLPAEVVRPLVSACETVRREAPAWREEKWVAEANLHVTVAFFGSVAEEAVPGLLGAVGAAVGGSVAFDLRFTRVRAVPGPQRCRMLWADFDDTDGLCALLADRVLRAAQPFGAEIPDRPFHAHVTLARARHPRALAARAVEAAERVAQRVPETMSVASATLFASTLTPAGSVYEILGNWPLGSA